MIGSPGHEGMNVDDPLGRDPGAVREFLAQYYQNVAGEDLAERDPVDVRGAALAHRRLAADRAPGAAIVRAYTPTRDEHGWRSDHTVVEIVTDDMPFIIDSVTAELARHGWATPFVVHPQLVVRRSPAGSLQEVLGPPTVGDLPRGTCVESWVRVELDRREGEGSPQLTRVAAGVERVLADVREVVEDWSPMRAVVLDDAEALVAFPPPGVDRAEVDETAALLGWLADDRFTLLGTREYALVDSDGGKILVGVEGTGLGLLRAGHSTPASFTPASFAGVPVQSGSRAGESGLLVVTRGGERSTVHKPVYPDCVVVRRFDADGKVSGEHHFLGLFTHSAYGESVLRIPVVRRRVQGVLDRSGFSPASHSGKQLLEILESYPREELFQTGLEDLHPIVLGVLRLQDRRQVRLFLRRDQSARFVSCLVYLPADRYTPAVGAAFQQILQEELAGDSVDGTARVSESPLALLHVIVRAAPGTALRQIDPDEVGIRLAVAARSWVDDLTDAITGKVGDGGRAPALVARYGDAFPEAYKEDFPARAAVTDIARLEELTDPDDFATELYVPPGAREGRARFKLYRSGQPLSLSRVLPILQRMGVEVVDERPYQVDRRGTEPAWIYDFGLRYTPSGIDLEPARPRFEDAFAAIWLDHAESDGFNALVLRAGVSWRQAMVLRAYAKFLRQAGWTFSQDYVEQSLTANPGIARLLVEYFESRFDPALTSGEQERSARIAGDVTAALDGVASLDQDRILRGYLALVGATLRTNYFQRDLQPDVQRDLQPDFRGDFQGDLSGRPKGYLSLKLDSRAVPNLPSPRPRFEIFVHSPRVEGVHLRFGAVARGGLRWSDRREDFRTEVLGLVKAQMVKNAVIVPVGSKGGFFCKRLPDASDRDAWLAEGVACYRTFISGLLDLTDNLVGGAVVPPTDVVRHDADDTYLVVAADKGTATFSDIANGLAEEYGYWLGDAFASGGSAGYDHKEMGITARGAWESVKWHFRDLGVDVAHDDFTCVGVGDMSGDVFGNGMLASHHIRLLAAFDHRHVFLDPSPDAGRSFLERERLYRLPRSSWADYDASLLSEGGGVYPRTAKSVPVSPQVRAALGMEGGVDVLTPSEMIRAILAAPADLFWNGGIGTYVKAGAETHADVGDRSNDALRVDAAELRCKVVGEGGNLGLTQRARIELALAGGRVNTDFIDNSAGVDTSDHEVNIKILLDQVVREKALTGSQRNKLLAGMTGEVADLVLRDNYGQNVALATARAQAPSMLDAHSRYITRLEQSGHLDRGIEFLPDGKTLGERRRSGMGLTGPELAVLLSYSKIALEQEIIDSSAPEDPYLREELYRYFPRPLQDRYRDQMDRHPLRREIITTCVVNNMVNHGGMTIAFRLNEETGADAADIARAYAAARVVFEMPGFWRAVEELDHQVGTGAQTAMLLEGRKLVERATRWLLHNRRPPLEIEPTLAHFGAPMVEVLPVLDRLLEGADRRAHDERLDRFVGLGVPLALAERVATMVPAYSMLDIVETAAAVDRAVLEVAQVYFDLADRLGLSRLRERIVALGRDDRWHSMARSALRDDLYAAHATLTRQVVEGGPAATTPSQLFDLWLRHNASGVARARQTLGELEALETNDVAILSVALRVLRTLVTSGGLPGAR
ncbi:MAG: NAD-glutamate dehydrogenase [Acidimicrobiales bacterium]